MNEEMERTQMSKGFNVVNIYGTGSAILASPVIGENGNWFIGNDDTGVAAKGKDGETPRIGENGNWFIGDIDTGSAARGPKGDTGERGPAGEAKDTVPVGTVISFMAVKAPEHYLICDGSEHRIQDYRYLAKHIEDNFGSVNFFGGDGVLTFAVPDLRNEFLRGYHGDSVNTLSGDIGRHQDATNHVGIQRYNNTQFRLELEVGGGLSEIFTSSNMDTSDYGGSNVDYIPEYSGVPAGHVLNTYTSRPTNVAVLFCIKYEMV